MDIQYEKFGLEYVAGRRVTHLSGGSVVRSQCGVHRLGLKVKQDGSMPLCRRCKKTVKVVKVLEKRIAVYRSLGTVIAWPEGMLKTELPEL